MRRLNKDDVRAMAARCGLKVNEQRSPMGDRQTWYNFYVGPDTGPGSWREGGASWIGRQSFTGTHDAYTFLQGFYAARNA